MGSNLRSESLKSFSTFRWALVAGIVLAASLCWRPAFAQDWPRLDDGRVVITVKDVRLALPTDDASLQEFHFHRVPGGWKSRLNLREVIANPALARGKFDEWESVMIARSDNPNYGGRFLWNSGTPEQRASRENLNNGNYRITIGGRNVRQICSSDHAGWIFIYGNITAPQRAPPHDGSDYRGCAGENVEVSYGSLFASDWTHDTLPILQKNITDLFNEILIDRSVRTYDHDLRDQ